jgi:hypothetical protein
MDKGDKPFGTYEVAKKMIILDIVVKKVDKKSEKMMSTLHNAFGAKEVNQPLMITKGKDEYFVREEDKDNKIVIVGQQTKKGKKRPLTTLIVGNLQLEQFLFFH